MKKIRALVVDDAAFVRDLVKKGLRDHFPDVHISEASDGNMARVQLDKDPIDIVLCDWEMPNMSGEELLQWMRAHEHTRQIPFVMITSRGEREHVMRAIELKADNYIVKPFTTDKLVGVVSRVLSRHLNVPEDSLRGLPRSKLIPNSLSGDLPIAATISADNAAPKPKMADKAPPLVARPRGKVLTQIRFGSESVRVLVKEVSLERLQAVIRRDGELPAILDLCVVDLETGDSNISRMNGYVHTLEARENRPESEFINITVEFIDQDADKMTHLRQYLQEIGGA